jgi:hypothetical protein
MKQEHRVDLKAKQAESISTALTWQKGDKGAQASHQDLAHAQTAKDVNTAG